MIGVGIAVRRAVHTIVVEGNRCTIVEVEEVVCCSLAVLNYRVAAGHRQAVGLVEDVGSLDHTAVAATSDTVVARCIVRDTVGKAVASLRPRASAIE